MRGYTLIELVFVIVIVGVLAAVALPRFVYIAANAHDAAVESAAETVKSSINNWHQKWVLEGGQSKGELEIDIGMGSAANADIRFNDKGWVIGADEHDDGIQSYDIMSNYGGGVSTSPCDAIFRLALGGGLDKDDPSNTTVNSGDINCPDNYDYCVSQVGNSGSEYGCSAHYQGEERSFWSSWEGRRIIYDARDGSVTVTCCGFQPGLDAP